MLNGVKILIDVQDVNHYKSTKLLEINQGSSPLDFYIQLWQYPTCQPGTVGLFGSFFGTSGTCDDTNGMRYIPAVGATMQIDFLRMNTVAQFPVSQSLSLAASQPFADDKSIWKLTLSSSNIDTIVSGGFRITLTEGAKTSVLLSDMTLRKLPSSEMP